MHRHNLAWRSLALVLALWAGPAAAQETARGAAVRDALARRPLPSWVEAPAADQALLDETFRIDIRSISVTFDYYPDQRAVEALARVEFLMRPGQSVPRFHFPPAERDASIVRSLVLDGERIPFAAPAVTSVRVTGSSQPILEVARHLSPSTVHTLDLEYRLNVPAAYPRFSSEVNDLAGHGNEERWPTLNTPHELARHHLVFRVHGSAAFRCIGSGLVQRRDDSEAEVQQWQLDTERELPSYAVMFVLLPESGTDLQERIIQGIQVRILAFRNGPSIPSAFASLQDWLPRLESAFGLYPAPRGLSVFLVSQGGGMEYFGGTISTPSALTHEVLHGYFACAVITRTYRDSWLDEAITEWYDDVSHGRQYSPIDQGYQANWVGARSPVSVGFSSLAYTDGARIMQYLADRVGGTARMAQFLRYVFERNAFAPFTTIEFAGFFRDFSGIDVQPQLEGWLYHALQR